MRVKQKKFTLSTTHFFAMASTVPRASCLAIQYIVRSRSKYYVKITILKGRVKLMFLSS